MTGNDIHNAVFEKAGMRGYRADQVDAYLHTVAAYIDEQNEKIEDLTYKLKVLAQKIEEYRADEESIRDALLGAQKLGTSIVNEAKAKAQTITDESQAAADELMAQTKVKVEALTKESLQRATADLTALKREYDRQQRNFDLLKKEISKFKNDVMQQYRSHIAMIMTLPSVEEKDAPAVEEPAVEAAAPAVAEEDIPVSAPVEEAPAAEEVSAPVFEEPEQVTLEEAVAEPAAPAAEEPAVVPAPMIDETAPTIEFKRAEETKTRPNYMEKFGELRFGSFNSNDK